MSPRRKHAEQRSARTEPWNPRNAYAQTRDSLPEMISNLLAKKLVNQRWKLFTTRAQSIAEIIYEKSAFVTSFEAVCSGSLIRLPSLVMNPRPRTDF